MRGTAGAADSYILTVIGPNNTPATASTTANTASLPSPLTNGKAYKWTVTSINPGGSATVLTRFNFKTKATPPQPKASLKFVPPIYFNDPSIPRNTPLIASVVVINSGNAPAPPSTVVFVLEDAVTMQVVIPASSAAVPQLAPNATFIASTAIQINVTEALSLVAILLDSTMATVDTINRIV